MIAARVAIGVLVLACVPARAENAVLPEAIVSCRDARCEAAMPPGNGAVRICIPATMLAASHSKRAPILVDARDQQSPMRRDGARWCAAAARDSRVSVRIGTRSIPVIPVTPIAAAPTPVLGTWEYLLTDRDRERVQLVIAEPVTHSEPAPPLRGLKAQPVPTSRLKLDPMLPDDQAFLDVVAIGDDRSAHCTGIAIATNAVLTAAHCAPATHVDLAVHTADVLRTSRVRETIVHPTLDVALLRLETPLPVTTRPRRHAADTRPPEGLLRTVGFGVNDPSVGAGFGIKRRADLAVSGWGCDAGRSVTTGCAVAAEMVVAAIGGRDTCWGDSGGPVLEPAGDTWRLVAITSRPTLHAGAACGRGGIYVRVDVIDAWLSQALEVK